MTPKALVIDDDPEILQVVSDILESLGHKCDLVDSVESARLRLEQGEYNYILLDLEIPVRAGRNLPRIQNGENLLAEIVQGRGALELPFVIVMTAHGTDGPYLASDVFKNGAADFVAKPFETVGPHTLDKKIQEALQRFGNDGGAVDTVSRRPEPVHIGEELKAFDGGSMVFYTDRVELCGADICSGPGTKRMALELLARETEGRFARYSGAVLANELGVCAAGGVIRDLRDRIEQALREQAGVDCAGDEVILSGNVGYRLSEKLTVQFEADPCGELDQGQPQKSRRVDLADRVPNVPDPHVPNVPDGAAERQAWILLQLEQGINVKTKDVASRFGCDRRTATRDLKALKDQRKIEFVGASRTGHYRLRGESGS